MMSIENFLALLIDYFGTFAFAISGIRLAAAKRFDWFGAYVIGVITAIGGGTLRDTLLGIEIFWLAQSHYFIITFLALIVTMIFKSKLVKIENQIFVFDAIGIALFTIIGIDKTLDLGYAWWVALIMGVISAVIGGVLRDIIINEVPLIFRKEIYATACFTGGALYLLLLSVSVPIVLCQISAMVFIFIFRCLAAKNNWNLRQLEF